MNFVEFQLHNFNSKHFIVSSDFMCLLNAFILVGNYSHRKVIKKINGIEFL